MEKPPMEWIDKLFDCLALFHGELWTNRLQKPNIAALYKIIWQSALYGCSYDEIRDVLVYFKQVAKNRFNKPPSHMEFHAHLVRRRRLCRP